MAGALQQAWRSALTDNEADSVLLDDEHAGPGIVATDRDDAMIAAARANAEAAEVADLIDFDARVVSHLRARSDQGLVLTNPPYGRRLGTNRLIGLYRRLGAVVRERLPGYGLALITSEAKLARTADGDLRPIASFRHGGLPVRLYHRPARPPGHQSVESSGSLDTTQLDTVTDR